MTAEGGETRFTVVPWRGRPVRIEHQWVGTGAPALVFLHEGLGSRAMWRDFPASLSAALGMRGLVYSRPGYGKSTPRTADERWEPDFMHRQAHEVLPALLDTLELREPVWLYGHSDGASIALLFAARFPGRVAGVIAAAPHIFVEDVSVESIERTRLAYLETDLRGKLARYHDDVDSAFWGWNDIWLDPPFRDWSIEGEIEAIRAPLLAVQGVDDEYGTMEQIRGIQRRVPHAKILELRDCGHSPHRDQPGAVIRAAVDFARSREHQPVSARSASVPGFPPRGNDTIRRIHMKRRTLIAALAAAATAAMLPASAQSPKLKVGFMLPYSGTFAALGDAIEKGFRLHLAEQGGRVGGREVEFFKVDDESDPAKATDNVNKLIKRDSVDVIIGTVHSGVAMAMAKAAKDNGTLLIIPNAGAVAVTGPMCAQNIFRSSFSNWQPGYAMGEVAAKRGAKKVVTITWKYAAGDESVGGFKEAFEKAGGQVVKELSLPFPNVEFQPLLTEIAAAKPDAVYTFFAGGGAVKFVKDYAAAGLKKTIPLYGAGFLTDGTLEAQGADADGLLTTLHYGDGLDNAKDRAFRAGYTKAYGALPDVYAVQGYDAAQMLAIGLNAVKGDVANKAGIAKAIVASKIDSPRGSFTIGASHNPVQDMYLRQVIGKDNKVIGVATRALADPGRGCKM